MSEQPHIEYLPEETRSKLRSTQILTSLPQIVSELLQNALDANATHIDIGADTKEWTCWVRDDGHGFTKDGLEQLGRYSTSKMYAPGLMNSVSTFGFRGEALASAADIACLEICSRTSKSRNTSSVILKGGKQLYLGPAVRWKRERPGTTICIRDAFYNLPVRRQAHPAASRTWELIKQEMEIYALVFPYVSFSLEDTGKRGDTVQAHRNSLVRIPKTSSTLNSFRHLYGQALTENIDEIDFSSDSTKIEGFISLTGAASKTYQFLYINRHPVAMSDFSRVIDSEFSKSSFGKNALDEEGETDLPRSTIRRSPRKLEKKPVFVLNITVSPEDVDNCLEPSKTSVELRHQQDVLFCLRTVIQQFLNRHGFLCRTNAIVPESHLSSSPRKRQKTDYHPIDDSGYGEDDSVASLSALSLENTQIKPRLTSEPLFTSPDAPGQEIIWQDPSTRERFVIDSRTGHSIRFSEVHVKQSDSTSNPNGQGRRTLRQGAPVNKHLPSTAKTQDTPIPQWLERALQENRAYAITENRIPSLPSVHSTTQFDPNQLTGHLCHRQVRDAAAAAQFRARTLYSATDTPPFTKETLRHARIIGQIDRKFIACQVAGFSHTEEVTGPKQQATNTLILVDQHAADERVRVERFLKELCAGFRRPEHTESNNERRPRVRELVPPRPVLLTQHEALRILQSQDVRELFLQWGIQFVEASSGAPDAYGDSDTGRSSAYSQLLVGTIPEIVCDKLLQGDELRDFIKGFLGQIQSGDLESDSRSTLPSRDDKDEVAWLKAVRRCPRVLLDLVNSKACRGAIMFNDPLSNTQCERLVAQLSETAFPFQCAHGRPSMLPLVETGALRRTGSKGGRPTNDWTRFEETIQSF